MCRLLTIPILCITVGRPTMARDTPVTVQWFVEMAGVQDTV